MVQTSAETYCKYVFLLFMRVCMISAMALRSIPCLFQNMELHLYEHVRVVGFDSLALVVGAQLSTRSVFEDLDPMCRFDNLGAHADRFFGSSC